MIVTSAETNVYRVSYFPEGRSVVEVLRLPESEWPASRFSDPKDGPYADVDEIVEAVEADTRGEVVEVIFVHSDRMQKQLYINPRFD